jgi:predicted transcriptional regulator
MRRHICQAELARMAAGLNRSYLSRAECGHVLLPLSKLLPLLRALGLSAVILRFDGQAQCNFRINLP